MFYEEEIPKVPLFEKALTPSDVGKLNRLVIPKQHAEKCFPLADNGSLLSFEDEGGKSWRFRYSYWSSSQSYVLTKGWSRFVKDKRLHAGDIVVFACHASDAARLFIASRTTTNTHAVADSPAPDQTPTVRGNCRTFRLFGVNLEYLPDEPEPEPEPEPTLHPYQHYYTDNTFSGAGPHHQR